MKGLREEGLNDHSRLRTRKRAVKYSPQSPKFQGASKTLGNPGDKLFI